MASISMKLQIGSNELYIALDSLTLGNCKLYAVAANTGPSLASSGSCAQGFQAETRFRESEAY